MGFSCRHQNICGSCTRLDWSADLSADFSLSEQALFKQNKLFSGLGKELFQLMNITQAQDIRYVSIGQSKIRDRVDMIYDAKIGLGFYQKKNTNRENLNTSANLVSENSGPTGQVVAEVKESEKSFVELFAVEQCEMMSSELKTAFDLLKKILDNKPLPIQHKGSLRLRMMPFNAAAEVPVLTGFRDGLSTGHLTGLTGKFAGVFAGIWLDFANTDIKLLLDEKTSLLQLLESGFFIEIGQKRKSLQIDNNGQLKLKDPVFLPWTKTWVQNQAIYLQSCVGSFSQAGSLANKAIIAELERFFSNTTAKKWLEFGAGSGNLTFALAGCGGRHVDAVELEPLAAMALEANKAQVKLEGCDFSDSIHVITGDFQKNHKLDFAQYQGVLVNPPRSGLKDFLTPLMAIDKNQRPKDFVYMSCFLDSFSLDAKKLIEMGYQLLEISIVDQFPMTEHFEILSRWRLVGDE